MSPAVRRIYLFHLFNTIAIAVVANFLFLDRLFLRLGLDMRSFGLIKGAGWLLPMTLNLLLAPFLQRWNRDREIIAAGYLLRVTLPFLFLLLPGLPAGGARMGWWAAAVLMGIHIFPVLANNSIDSLLRAHLPRESMGRHLGRITLLWTLPGYLLAIPLAAYVDRHASGGDAGFYRALSRVMLGTAVFQVPASLLILGVPRRRASADRREPGAPRLRDIAVPFRDAAYRRLLLVVLVFAVLTSMIYSFINPYLLQVRGMAMRTIGAIGAAVAVLSSGALPFWGRLADRIGGKNILRVAVSGFALGVLALFGEGVGFVLLFALLCWEGMRGVFGSGIYSTQRYLAQVLSDGRKPNIDFAAVTFCSGVGWAAGAVLGGLLLEWLERRAGLLHPFHRYRVYFACCLAGCLLLGRLVPGLEEDRRRLGWREIGAAVVRAAGRGLRRPP